MARKALRQFQPEQKPPTGTSQFRSEFVLRFGSTGPKLREMIFLHFYPAFWTFCGHEVIPFSPPVLVFKFQREAGEALLKLTGGSFETSAVGNFCRLLHLQTNMMPGEKFTTR